MNCLRAVPPLINPYGAEYDPEEDEPILEPAWTHLSLVYEIFIRFLELPDLDITLVKKHVDQNFVIQLLALFDVEDPRERDMVKTSVHRIYGKMVHLRAFIRKAMRNIFTEFVYEEDRHNVAEMLEILGSIINGFAIPIREEHKVFLAKTLLPLHKHRSLSCYFTQLSFCMVQYVEKEPSLADGIVRGLLRIWPKTCSAKEVMFLNEIEEIVELSSEEDFIRYQAPLLRQLVECIENSHFQVAERALLFWNNEHFVRMVSEASESLFPLIVPRMAKNAAGHWNRNVQSYSLNALKVTMSLNPELFDACAAQLDTQKDDQNRQDARRRILWARLAAQAAENQSSENENPNKFNRKGSLPGLDEKIAESMAEHQRRSPGPPTTIME